MPEFQKILFFLYSFLAFCKSGFSINSKDVFFQKVIKRKKTNVNFNFFIGMVKEFPKIELDYEHTEFGIFKINCSFPKMSILNLV